MSAERLTPPRLRVAVVIPAHWDYAMGGAEYQAKLLVEHLYAEHEVEIAWFSTRVGATVEFPDHRVVPVGKNDGRRKYGHFWDYFGLFRALRDFGPDVIYQRVSCAYAGIAARYARRFRVPMISHISSENDCRRAPAISSLIRRPHVIIESRLAKRGLMCADVLVAQTGDQQRLLRDNFARQAKIIRNYHPVPAPTGKPRDAFTIAWVANLKALKRPERMLDIASQLAAEPHIEVVMCGQPYPAAKDQDAFVRAVKTRPNVTYTGSLSQDSVNQLLDRSALLINTSDYEGFPNVFIQAWMRAVPVATLGVNPDGLLNREFLGGRFDNEQDLSSYTRRLSADFDTLEEMGHNARLFATKRFSMANAAELSNLIVSEARSAFEGAVRRPIQ